MIAPAQTRGYFSAYRSDGTDRCLGCGRQHFYVGRVSVECAMCGVAMPLPEARNSGGVRPVIWRRGRGG